jgi:hypothetical protein
MKNVLKIMTLIIPTILIVGCKSENVKPADANYMQQLNTINQSNLAKAQIVSSLAKACEKNEEDSSWCVALVAQSVMNNGNGQNNAQVPSYKPTPSKSDIFLSKSMDLIGKALPLYGSYAISKNNNEANVAIEQSRNDMLTGIVTSGFSNMTALGSQETISVGGDYIIGNENGDGDRYGDGNIIGDGNVSTGDGSLVGDSNILGNDNVTGNDNLFANGDGNVIGDENTNTTGNDNIVGDANTSTDGNENAVNNDVEGDLFTGGSDNGDEEPTPQPDPPL